MPKQSLTNASHLPERLKYLQPFRKKFASRPDDLNEDSGWPPLMKLLTKRVRGLSDLEAEMILSEDFTALQQWLAAPANQNDPLHFVFGLPLIASPADVMKLIREEAENATKPKPCLFMELPPGARERRVPGGDASGKLVTLKKLWLTVSVLPEDAVESVIEATTSGWRDRSVVNVRFGSVTGRKFVTKGEDRRGLYKELAYALTVPGGWVYGSICAIGKKVDELNWDETPFESCFHTLRVETKPPPQPAPNQP